MNWFESVREGIVIRVKVQPRAKRSEIVGLYGDPPRLKIRLAAPPVDGKANEELIGFIKEKLNLTQSQIRIIRGETSALKDLLCFGVSVKGVEGLIE